MVFLSVRVVQAKDNVPALPGRSGPSCFPCLRALWRVQIDPLLFFPADGLAEGFLQMLQQLGLEPQPQRRVLAAHRLGPRLERLQPLERAAAGLVVVAQLLEDRVSGKNVGQPLSQVGEPLAHELEGR